MEFVDKIKRGAGPNGSVSDPDKIISFKSNKMINVIKKSFLLRFYPKNNYARTGIN